MHESMDSPTRYRGGLLLSLALVLFLGSSYCEAQGSNPFTFTRLTMFGGDVGINLQIQEGAIVDIVCKEDLPTFNNNVIDALTFKETGNNQYGVRWTLGENDPNLYPIDHNVFPVEANWEVYASVNVGVSSTSVLSTSLFNKLAKSVSTLHYTARMEDYGKFIACSSSINGTNAFAGAYVYLWVKPGPAPLTFKSTILRTWRGGFLGEINIPISDYITSWKIHLHFAKKVDNLQGSNFQVAAEPCLHDGNCGVDAKNTWVIYNTFSNHVLNPGDDLRLVFIAETGKKLDRGLKAEVTFYGFNEVFMSEIRPELSSSDIQVNI